MRIVCLIKPLPPTIYFVNHIHQHYPIELVVVEENAPTRPPKPFLARIAETIRTYGLLTTLDSLIDRFRGCRDPTLAHNEFFGDQWCNLDPSIPRLDVQHINSEQCLQRLSTDDQPDLILDHGTSIVGPEVLSTAPLALNLHWGLSPYYRGINCTEWALVNWDPFNIGVTIHKLAKQIDGGDIVAQRRATVRPDDDVHALNMQLTKLGTDLVVDIVGRLQRGDTLTFHQQDYSAGFVTLSRQWGRHWLSHVRYIERHGVIKKMLNRPARKERLPIIELS